MRPHPDPIISIQFLHYDRLFDDYAVMFIGVLTFYVMILSL